MSRSSLQREGKRGGLSFLASKIDEKHRMKEAIGNHRTGLPSHLLNLFQGRPAPQYLEPLRKKKPTLPLTGIATYTEHFENEPKEAPAGEDHKEQQPVGPDGEEVDAAAAPVATANEDEPKIFLNPEYALQVRLDKPTRLERLVNAKKESHQRHKEALEAAIAAYTPSQDPNIEGDPLKTLFVARLADEVSERKLRREFEEFGPIKRIQIIHDKKTDKPRGYAFIEYEHKSDMKEAYKSTDGMRIEGKRVLVDVERGRTVPGWLPRRLGGGKGESRAARLPKDPTKRRINGIVSRLAGVEDGIGGVDGGGMVPMDEERGDVRERDRERDRSRDGGGGGGRYRDRERETSRRDRDRDSRRRDRGGRDRDRDDYYRGGERDSRKRERERGGGYDEYSRGGYGDGPYVGGGGGRDYGGEAYNTVPPPGSAMPSMGISYPPAPMGGAVDVDDEPEEGEFVEIEAEEGEREAKRPRGVDE